MRHRFSPVFTLLALCCSPLFAADLYVAPTGNDTNAGTLAAPFQTLARAQTEVRSLLPAATAAINVWVRAGTYRLSAPLVFGPADSGTPAAPVKYSAYADETVTLSGAVLLAPAWTTHSGSILVATIGTGYDFDLLTANNVTQVLARYPNYDANVAILDGHAADALSTARARVTTWANPATGLVRGLHGSDWGGNSFKITGKDANGAPTLQWVGDNNRGNSLHATYRMVENIFEELDAPGEWFYDKPAGKLYFHPPAGLNAATATFEASTLEELVKVVGTAPLKVKHLTFDKFTYTGTRRTLFTRPYEPLLRGDWCVVRAGAVFIQDAENITLSNSRFDRVGGNAVFISGYNRNHLVTQNEFTDTGATCVNVVGLTSAVREPSFWPHALYPNLVQHRTTITDTTPGPLTDDYPKDCAITYNHMVNMGRFEKQTCGVNLSMSESITVGHNTIHRSPRAGININDGTWGGHIIEFNDVFDCVRETGDHGPFNSWGRDRFWSYGGYNTNGSIGAQKRPYALLDAWKTTRIRNNRFHYTTVKTWGIDLDDGSSNYEIYNNLCLNTGFKLREGFDRKVYNNILVNERGNLHVWFDQARDNLQRNLIVNGSPWAFAGLSSTNMAAKEPVIDDNVFWNGTNANTITPGFSGWAGLGLDTRSLTAAPQFANPAALDYTVQAPAALATGFVNFPMNQFGKPGAPTPPPISTSGGVAEVADTEPLMGATITSIYSETVKSATGLGDSNGVYLYNVPAGSYASYQGLATNDVIRAINGTTVTTKLSYWTVYNSLPPGSTVPLTVRRDQLDQALTFVKTTAPETLNDTAGATFAGTGWQTQKNTAFYNGDIRYTRTNGDSFTQTFYGTGIDVIAETYSDETQSADVYIDDILQANIATFYSTTRLYQQVVYSKTGLPYGPHTLRIVNRTSNYMFLDAVVVRTDLVAPVLTATPAHLQIALTWTTSPGAATYTLQRSDNPTTGFTPLVTGLTTPDYTDTGLTTGATYYYKVTALPATGTGIDSAVVTATVPAQFINRATGGAATASAQNAPNETAAKAFDGITSTKWFNANSGATGWLAYDFGPGNSWTITRYEITSANDQATRNPRDWQLQGSDDGTTWTTLDTRAGETFATFLLVKSYNVAAPAPYRYYRLNITANSGATALQLSEFALHGTNLPLPATAPAALAATPGNGQVSLAWQTVPGATAYLLKRATSVGGPYLTLTSPSASAATDTTVVNGTTYFYTLAALNAAGAGPVTGPVTATPLLPPVSAQETQAPPFLLSAGIAMLSLDATVPNRTYQLQRSYTLAAGSWVNLGSPATGTGGPLDFADTPAPAQPRVFYRILIGP